MNFAAYICFGEKMFNMARFVSASTNGHFCELLSKCNLVINYGDSKSYNYATNALLHCSVGKTYKKAFY